MRDHPLVVLGLVLLLVLTLAPLSAAPKVPLQPAGLLGTGIPPSTPAAQVSGPQVWIKEWADAPHRAYRVGSRGLALDSAGRPHLAYASPFVYYASQEGGTWRVETVDTSAVFDFDPAVSLALDAEDHPHLAYSSRISYTAGMLKYAYHDGTAWRVQTVDEQFGGRPASLVLDAAGRPHISYCKWRFDNWMYDYYPDDLRYAYYDGETWHLETVDSEGDVGSESSLVLDGAGQPHISYLDYTNRQLKYAWYDGNAWYTEAITSGGGGTSLVLDANGLAHIAHTYEDTSSGRTFLTYSYFDGTTWRNETVDDDASAPSLLLDAAGLPHISYTGSTCRYAVWNGAAWQIQEIDSGGLGTSLSFDGEGLPHIAYAVNGPALYPAYLRYASWSGPSWEIETVDGGWGVAGMHTSLALDTAGNPHISHHGCVDLGCVLKYTYSDGATWHSQIVDGGEYGDQVGQYSSLALDGADRPHISYFDSIRSLLKYAWHDGITWQIETVYSYPYDDVVCTSLALDAPGQPHIAYYHSHYGSGSLMYASYTGSAWDIQNVTAASSCPSLALDSDGWAHIGYATVGAVAYAHQLSQDSWEFETVDTNARYPSLALDATGTPHLAYAQGTCLRYARRTESGWSIGTVDCTGVVQQYLAFVSLALEDANQPRISYFSEYLDALVFAWYDDSTLQAGAWLTATVDSQGVVGRWNSLALDAAGRPRISYEDGSHQDLKYAWVCTPVDRAAIQGSTLLVVDGTGLYTATYAPITASLPVSITWDGGAVGPTAAYSWTDPGHYTVTASIANRCGQFLATLAVTVCQPLEGVSVAGPFSLLAGQSGTYQALLQPPAASPPFTITWSNGSSGLYAAFSWPDPGAYTLTITATNLCGGVHTGSFQVRVLSAWPYSFYLPVVMSDSLADR